MWPSWHANCRCSLCCCTLNEWRLHSLTICHTILFMQSSVLWEDTGVMCFGFKVGKVRPYICRCVLCCSTRNGCHLQSRAPGLRSPSKMSSAQHSPAQGRCTCIEERMNDSALQSRSGASDAQLHGAIESLQPLTWRWLCISEITVGTSHPGAIGKRHAADSAAFTSETSTITHAPACSPAI